MSRLFFTSLLLVAVSSFASAEPAMAPSPFAQPPQALRMPDPVTNVTLDRATVRAALAEARATNLAAFRAYQKKGVFPSNTYRDSKLNVWRDKDGHLCAAATIINQSGQHALVANVAEQNNFIRLADVEQGPLMDWILTSGFTQQEIAAIQEPFMPVASRPDSPSVIAAKRWAAENARLRTRYTQVTKQLVKSEQSSLDVAVDRLMAHPQVAARFIAAARVSMR